MLEVREVSLGYGATLVVKGVSLALAQGEIGCLLGASGCGKTTLLRAIAGFEPVREGQIRLQGETMGAPGVHVPPQQRDVGMVFQDHALFPHLDVAGNVAFGLHRLPASERAPRVGAMLDLVGLQGMERRWPHELSGGQQQRVALARALAPQPSVLLMDEPFSSLDASLRETIAREVRSILKRAGATALMVTHDQNEAFAMADHIGVMVAGDLEQWGTALAVYGNPATLAVAQFVGDGVLVPAQRDTAVDGWRTALGVVPAAHPHYGGDGLATQVLLRPEHVALLAPEHGVPATVQERRFRGSHFLYALALEGGAPMLAHAPLAELHEPGTRVGVTLKPAAVSSV